MKFDLEKLHADEGHTYLYHKMDEKGLAFHNELKKRFVGENVGGNDEEWEYWFFVTRDDIGVSTGWHNLGSGRVIVQKDGSISIEILKIQNGKQYRNIVLNELHKKVLHFFDVAGRYGYLRFD